MDNTDFDYIDIMDEMGTATDNWLGKRAEQKMILIEEEDVDFECDYDCDGCWFDPESCGKFKNFSYNDIAKALGTSLEKAIEFVENFNSIPTVNPISIEDVIKLLNK